MTKKKPSEPLTVPPQVIKLTETQLIALQVLQDQWSRDWAAFERTTNRLHTVMAEAGLDPGRAYDVDDDGHATVKGP